MNDLKFALRQLLKNPGFTIVAVLTLAIGIGANTIVLSWIRGILFNAIPGVNDPADLVVVCREHKSAGLGDTLSRPDILSLAEEPGLFSGVTGSQMGTATIRVGKETSWMWVEVPMANYFDVLGVKPVLGRGFLTGEDTVSPPEHAVVISHHLWRQQFQGDPAVIGRVVEVNRQPATIVGVAPSEFRGTMGALRFDAWIAPALYVEHEELAQRLEGRGWRWLHTVARLAPGMSLTRARTAAHTLARRLSEEYPKDYRDSTFAVLPVWKSPWGGQGRFLPLLQALGTAALLLLLLVTANVANLLLARGRQRESEIAVRLALGAPPRRIVRQLLVESLLLAVLGGWLGVALASFGVPLLFTLLPPTYLPIALELGLDAWVLALTAMVTLAAGLMFGLAPALQCAGTNLQQTLKAGGRTVVKSPRHYLRLAFVIGEVALAMVLLIGMGLCLRSLNHSRQVSLGLDPKGVFVAGFRISPSDGDDARVNDFYRRLRREAEALPNIESAALADWLPLGFEGGSSTTVGVEGYQPAPGESMDVDVSLVSPGYFSTLRIPLKAGRDFREGEDANEPFAIVVNETFARRYFGERDPAGLKVRFWNREATVVGVAGNGKYHSLNEPATPWLYVNQLQVTDRDQTLILRGGGSMDAMRRAVEQLVNRIDPTLRPFAAMSYVDFVGAAFVVPRVAALLLSTLGLLALFLSMIGIYAVVSQQVAQRTREMAIRLALGAPPRDVLGQVMRDGLGLALVGL
ncbi:MAG TPA: ABC transporter permease, partial [Verrucomicrobiae bacterium]|nr:ABC transporter permease [Verrucomicrobiae bacterium]